MANKGGKFHRKSNIGQTIPTSSMADIAFLLLVFFMVTTIFKLEDGLPVEMPKAESGEKVPRDKVAHIWIDRLDHISINDNLIDVGQVQNIIYLKLLENPALLVAFNVDKNTKFETVDAVMSQLKQANATRVSFTADPERSR
ncbi:MAG: biopolymer transporter ExbD [Gemmatimonadetes bacterium]|nr:biopolymer transporter ExbD [Gemmatimonadota bacterium]